MNLKFINSAVAYIMLCHFARLAALSELIPEIVPQVAAALANSRESSSSSSPSSWSLVSHKKQNNVQQIINNIDASIDNNKISVMALTKRPSLALAADIYVEYSCEKFVSVTLDNLDCSKFNVCELENCPTVQQIRRMTEFCDTEAKWHLISHYANAHIYITMKEKHIELLFNIINKLPARLRCPVKNEGNQSTTVSLIKQPEASASSHSNQTLSFSQIIQQSIAKRTTTVNNNSNNNNNKREPEQSSQQINHHPRKIVKTDNMTIDKRSMIQQIQDNIAELQKQLAAITSSSSSDSAATSQTTQSRAQKRRAAKKRAKNQSSSEAKADQIDLTADSDAKSSQSNSNFVTKTQFSQMQQLFDAKLDRLFMFFTRIETRLTSLDANADPANEVMAVA